MSGVKASDILIRIAKRHTKDFFITECKNGPTWFGPHHRMDAVAIVKSWAHPNVTAYEIKVSRSDWERDNKWQFYLKYCNTFYIAAAPGIVSLDELPDGVGLFEYTGRGLRHTRKAVYQERELYAPMLMYVIMNYLDSDRIPFYRERQELAKAYLKDKADRTKIGSAFGTKMAQEIADRYMFEAEYEAHQKNKKTISAIEEVIKKNGHGRVYGEYIAEWLDGLLKKGYKPPKVVGMYLRSAGENLKEISEILFPDEVAER